MAWLKGLSPKEGVRAFRRHLAAECVNPGAGLNDLRRALEPVPEARLIAAA